MNIEQKVDAEFEISMKAKYPLISKKATDDEIDNINSKVCT